MASQKITKGQLITTKLLPLGRRGISTRSQNANIHDQNLDPTKRNKRKAEATSPLKNIKVKRSALGNLTNAFVQDENHKTVKKIKKKIEVQKKTVAVLGDKNANIEFVVPPVAVQKIRATKILTRAAARSAAVEVPSQSQQQQQPPPLVPVTTIVKIQKDTIEIQKPITRRISNEFEQTEDSLYMSALEDISSTSRYSSDFETKQKLAEISDKISLLSPFFNDKEIIEKQKKLPLSPKCPDNVVDFDKENWNDPFQISNYVMDIFHYLKEREKLFQIDDYMERQICLSKWMRSLLVDWMVEVQESFELNHETLYLAVKIVDIYLGKAIMSKESLQLLGAAALFIASKFDERTPPLIDDFLYICDGAYNQKELIRMEINVFRTIDFDLGIPLSYRFLRRYARCLKVSMPVLTLARFILEYSLMDYETIQFSDSKMAAATMFMALRMNKQPGWNDTLKYYSGYNVEDFADIIPILNAGLHRKPKHALKTIRNKYSHKIFYEVAKIPLLTNCNLFDELTIITATPPPQLPPTEIQTTTNDDSSIPK